MSVIAPAPLATLAPLPALRCPLCDRPNGCVPAATGTFALQPCWCANTTFSKDLLKRVPAAAAGLACICRACANKASP